MDVDVKILLLTFKAVTSLTVSPPAGLSSLVDGDWLTATQALMCIGLIVFVIASLMFIYFVGSWSRYFCVKVLIIILFVLACEYSEYSLHTRAILNTIL